MSNLELKAMIIECQQDTINRMQKNLQEFEEKLWNSEYRLNEERNESYAKDLEILCLKAQLYDLLHPVA